MQNLKKILIVLLFFINLVFAFNKPGGRSLESFISLSEKKVATQQILLKYPPGTYLIYKALLKKFPLSQSNPIASQNIWLAWKTTLFSFYLLVWIALLYLTKSSKSSERPDTSILFLGSASITLIALSIGLSSALPIAPFIISLYYLFRKKISQVIIFYIVAIFFNWYLLIFAPFYFIYISKNYPKSKILLLSIIFLVFPLLIGSYLIRLSLGTNTLAEFTHDLKFLGFYNLTNVNLYLNKNFFNFPVFGFNSYSLLQGVILGGLTLIIVYFVKSFLRLRLRYFLFGVIGLITLMVGLINQYLFLIFLAIFFGLFLIIFRNLLKKRSFTTENFLKSILAISCIGSLFLPNISDGNLIFIPILALILYLLFPSKEKGRLLFAVNIVTFSAIFLFNGVSRFAPMKGSYYELIRILLVFAVLFFYTKIASAKNYIFVKKFLIFFLILLNFALLASDGSPDIVSWREYSYTLSKFPNPFYAQTVVDQRYPPLSTVILGVFTTSWQKTFGLKPVIAPINPINVVEYGYPAKASVIFFYFLTLGLFIKLSRFSKKRLTLTISDKFFVGLTVFSLMIQTQGFVDFNIHVIPTLILSILALYRQKYLLSGLLMGVTVSIKWQPVILIPVFIATLFTFEMGAKEVIRKSSKFLFGLILIPIITWALVIRQPGGQEAFNRSFLYLKQGAPKLSGQALNLNWIVTYGVHIFQPEKDVSLTHLGGLNRQIDTPLAPKIFQGYLFILAALIILAFYWLKQKKTIVNFMAASIMVFFSHQILNKSAYEKHFFYPLILMLFLYLIRPTKSNKILLYVFDVMTIMNLVFFYGFTGPKVINRLVFGFDITVLFSLIYLLIYLYIFAKYISKKLMIFGT